MYRILIVEDDPVITETLCAYMGRWGMEARGVEDFQNVLREFAAFDPQLVLMDISLPFFDGYHWCAEIRKISTAPILFISSAGDNLNILRALDAGADDFVSKPFDLSVLMAKVQALLRRAYDFAGQSALLTCGDLTFRAPDMDAFPCLRIARQCARTGGTACAIMNGANEAAVALFLQERVGFNDIPRLVESALSRVQVKYAPDLPDILEADRQARAAVLQTVGDMV